jgi:hypothetical protein
MVIYKCDICNKEFNKKCNYEYHRYNRKYPCKLVITANNANNKNTGSKIDKIAKTFECDKCDKTYKHLPSLSRHKALFHRSKTDANNCANKTNIFENTLDDINSQYKNDTNIYIKPIEINTNKKENNFNQEETILNQQNGKKLKLDQIEPIINELQCSYCKSIFTYKSALTRHIQYRCKVKKAEDLKKEEIIQEELKKDDMINKLLEQLNIQNKQLNIQNKHLEEIKEQNKEIVKENKELKGSTIIGNNKCTTNNNNTNNTNNTNNINNTLNNINTQNNINIVAFGQEDLSYLSDKICKNICGTGYQSPINLIKEIHFNKDKPEHHNVYISNMKDQYCNVYDGKKWRTDIKEEVIETLYDDSKCFLEEKYNEIKGDMHIKYRKKYDRFVGDKSKHVEKNAKNDVKLMLYNDKNIPLKTRRNEEMSKNESLNPLLLVS